MNNFLGMDIFNRASLENTTRMTEEQTRVNSYDVRRISSDYGSYDRAVRRLENTENTEDRRVGYEILRDEIYQRYHPEAFTENVYDLAYEFSQPYNRHLFYDNPPYTSTLPEDASDSRLREHYLAFIFILYTEIQQRLSVIPEKINNDEADKIGLSEALIKRSTIVQNDKQHEERIRKLEINDEKILEYLESLGNKVSKVEETFVTIGQVASAFSTQTPTQIPKPEEQKIIPQTRTANENIAEETNAIRQIEPRKAKEITLISRYDGEKLISIYYNLQKEGYLTCTEDAWLYVWGVKKHPKKGHLIKRPEQLPIWNVKRGKKVAFAEMVRYLKSSDCGKYLDKASNLFVYSDGSWPVASNLKKHRLGRRSKIEFLTLLQ